MKFSLYKQQYLYLALALISVCIALTSHVLAQEHTMTDGTKMQGMKNEMKDTKAVGRASISEDTRNRTTHLIDNSTQKMTSATGRLDDVAKRLETRLAKLSQKGVDTKIAEEALARAVRTLDEAKQAVATARTSANASLTSDSPRESFKTARTQFATARQLIRDSFISLRETINEMKDAVQEAQINRGVSSAAAVMKSKAITE